MWPCMEQTGHQNKCYYSVFGLFRFGPMFKKNACKALTHAIRERGGLESITCQWLKVPKQISNKTASKVRSKVTSYLVPRNARQRSPAVGLAVALTVSHHFRGRYGAGPPSPFEDRDVLLLRPGHRATAPRPAGP